LSRLHHQQGGQPSQRMLRVGELVRHAVCELLTRGDIGDPALDGKVVTIPDVRMSPDLKLATVYVMPLGGENVAGVLAAFDRHKKFFRGEVARRVNLRFAPDVRFKADPNFDYSGKIDALLNSPKVRQDLALNARQDEGGEPSGRTAEEAD
jgi:ribosome-binding factor A